MKGRFASLRDEVVYRATLDGSCPTMGSVEWGCHYAKLIDFYGYDYLVTTTEDGFVDVERFDHIDIDESGYFTPVERAWAALVEDYQDPYDPFDEDGYHAALRDDGPTRAEQAGDYGINKL